MSVLSFFLAFFFLITESANSAPPKRLALSGATSINQNICSSAFSVRVLRKSATVDTPVLLTQTGSGVFYSDSGCTAPIAGVSIPTGQTATNFYFKDATAELVTLRAVSSGYKSASLSVTINSTAPPPPTPPADDLVSPTAEWSIVPVVLVASDLTGDTAGIQNAVSNFMSINTFTRDWYRYRAELTYAVSTPVVLNSIRDSAEWIRLSEISAISEHRYDFFYALYGETSRIMGANRIYVAVPYAGNLPDTYLGAAGGGNFAAIPPRGSSVSCPTFAPGVSTSSGCSNSSYALGHEAGHNFGMGHSCDDYPNASNCGSSIMQTGVPPNAILLPGEINTVVASPYFTR